MNRRYHIPVLLLLFVYFLSFITGRPGSSYDPYFDQDAVLTDTDVKYKEESAKTKRSYWKEGLLSRVLIQKEALDLLSEDGLENDAVPEHLFRSLERSKTGDQFLLFLNASWLVLILLTLAALFKSHWFYAGMARIILSASSLILLTILLTSRKDLLFHTGGEASAMFEIILESVLLFLSLFLLMKTILPASSAGRIPFMDHLEKFHIPFVNRMRETFESLVQILILLAVGVILSNTILLPIYKMQLQFPEFFAGLFLFSLILLAVFYTAAYIRVSKSNGQTAGILSGAAFLGFRILRNTLFLSLVTGLIGMMLGTVIAIALFNIGMLQDAGFLNSGSGF